VANAHAANIVARILSRKLEREIEDVPREDQFGFGRGNRDAIGMLIITSEQTLDIDEDACTCFIDWQKAFDHVNWTKLMQILNNIGTN
jgi:hypothetical protein